MENQEAGIITESPSNSTIASIQSAPKLYCDKEDILFNLDVLEGNKCMWSTCNRRFLHLDDLINHVNEEHVKMEKDTDYTCRWEGCARKGKAFNARYKMLIHVRTHTNERPHRCRLCGKSFSRLENLKIHHRSHTGEKPYMCPVEGCSKAYSNSSDRFKHTRTHFVDKPYICKKEGCNKRYTDPSSLRKHMKTYGHYQENREFALPSRPTKICGQQLSILSNMRKVEIKTVDLTKLAPTFVIDVAALTMNPILSAATVKNIVVSGTADDMNDLKRMTVLSSVNGSSSNCTTNSPKLPKNEKSDQPLQKCQASPLDLTVNNLEVACSSSNLIGNWEANGIE